MRIGLISDTHGWIHPSLYKYFSECDEIWHAGDIGSSIVADELSDFKPFRAVYGNIDDASLRRRFRQHERFKIAEMSVWMTHIGGTPSRYAPGVAGVIHKDPPDIFICGHSHIARVQSDPRSGFLYVNPGAAGYHGFHRMMTAIRFTINGPKISDFELIELGERGKAPIGV
jgi:uncharacterized protein